MKPHQEKIKILFLIESLKRSGAERQLLYLLEGLNPDRFDVTLITWQPSTMLLHQHDIRFRWVESIRKHKLDFSVLFTAYKLVKKKEIDIVYGFLDTGNLYTSLLKFFPIQFLAIASERNMTRKLSFFQKLHKPLAHRKANLTIANSEEGKKFIQSFGIPDSRLIVHRNGIDLTSFSYNVEKADIKEQLSLPTDRAIYLCVGRILPHKRQVELAKLFAEIISNACLVFIGRIDNGIYGSALTNQLKHHPNKFIHISETDQIHKYYQAANLLIQYSTREGSPNVVMEAMASGLPVLASRAGDTETYVDSRNGWLVDIDDESQMKSILQQVGAIESKKLSDMGQISYHKLIQLKCDLPQFIKSYQSLFQSLVEK